jgi:hypothetical protein
MLVAPVVEQPQVEVEPIKLARTQDVSYVSDVGPVVYKPIEEEGEVAYEPKIISSSDDRELGINWSAWLILIGLVAVSFLVAGVSYYGYSQAVATVARQKARDYDAVQMEDDYLPKEEPVKPSAIEQNEVEHSDFENNESNAQASIVEEDDEDIEVRW